MIKFIAAIDEKRGLANDEGIPWDLPKEGKYFTDQISSGLILMGLGTYRELKEPFHNRTNHVATRSRQKLRHGFEIVTDTNAFLDNAKDDVWVIGGAQLFASTLKKADKLYITQLEGDFNCTKFFPEFREHFELQESSQPQLEKGVTYRFEIWRRKK
jgi:dihydrofolate reductase